MPVMDSEIVSAALGILARRIAKGSIIKNMEDAKRYLAVRCADLQHEVFAIVYLTNRHAVIACDEIFRGTIDGASTPEKWSRAPSSIMRPRFSSRTRTRVGFASRPRRMSSSRLEFVKPVRSWTSA